MTEINDMQDSAGRVYAQAIFDLAEARSGSDEVLEELGDLVAAMDQDPGIDRVLTDSRTDADVRAKLIDRMLRGRASDLLVDSLQVINRKGRMGSLRSIAASFRAIHEAARNQVDVSVTTAVPLSDELREALRKVAAKYTGREVRLRERVDSGVLGGVVIQIGDTKLDTSISRHLRRIRAELVESGARAIQGEGEAQFIQDAIV